MRRSMTTIRVTRAARALSLLSGCALWAFAAAAQEIHSESCLYGCPLGGGPTDDLIIRDIYVLRSNDLAKFADWVAYRVTRDTIGPTQKRTWRVDPWLDGRETLEPDDYTGAHGALRVDRGHQAPLASFTSTPHWEETNYLSNITPQKSDLNQGAWQRLESAERKLAQAAGIEAVYVMTGPLYEKPMSLLPRADEAHVVPSGYWKVISVKDGDSAKVAAFIFEQQTPRGADLCGHVVSVRNVEWRSGFNFFHGLDIAAQDALETGAATLAPALGCSQ